MSARFAEGPRAQQHGVRRCSQESHHETVGGIAPTDDLARLGITGERDYAVEGSHEICEYASSRQAERTAIALTQRMRHAQRRALGVLKKQFERLPTRRDMRS